MSFTVIKHPLILDKLTRMRKKDSNSKVFKENLDEIAQLMAYEIFRDLELNEFEIETPVARTQGYKIARDIVLFPILRAGLGMVDGIIKLVPNAKIGHIGMYRDEKTMQPHEYFAKKPSSIENANVLILDPMLATGGSACLTIEKVKEWGAQGIKLVCLVAAPEGRDFVAKEHPDVAIYVAALDEKLNEKGYIVPGLGDAGDRIFGTK
ncbi:uracil phosphoribosyltransferase [Spiroplasma mirum ATCC 29335]|uniref:Uracil phosphoribosyltransferase n=1 Tax=Spiroplasma mirum ATCC 29335 TaxID=838561 RepID=W0GK66_9MOLU|nr:MULTISPECIES: uracil phosphoribosyltransferase [Spiroplasma]AHF60562.1 uracil phosphoribosyltransferase [Spiroplasma mirum ATCC 29335]AHI57485.1 uracil phosphoribosyltransferase [Spiroplasma mirum ATCC 29335]AKM52679.1 uracil phosphoribosyltransferase [Spiroplasma atrichopogonis]